MRKKNRNELGEEPVKSRSRSKVRTELSRGYFLLPPTDLKELQNLGRHIFDNCLSNFNTTVEYFQEVKSGKAEIHVLYDPKEKPVAIFKIDVCDRRVTDFGKAKDGSENSDRTRHTRRFQDVREVEIPHRVLVDVMKKLDCADDSLPDMVRCGLLTRFLEGVPYVDPIQLHDGRRLYVYAYANEIITVFDFDSENEENDDQISRFFLETRNHYPSWEGTPGNSMEVGELLWLTQHNPALRKKLITSTKL